MPRLAKLCVAKERGGRVINSGLCVADMGGYLLIDDCLVLKSLGSTGIVRFKGSWVYRDAVVSPVGIVLGGMRRVDVKKPLVTGDCKFLCSVRSGRRIMHVYDCKSHWAIKATFERSRARQYSIIHKSQGAGALLLALSILLNHYGMRDSQAICIENEIEKQLKSANMVSRMVA